MELKCSDLSTLLCGFFAAIVCIEVERNLLCTGGALRLISYRVVIASANAPFPNLNCCRNRIDEATIAYRRPAVEMGL